MNDAAKTPLKKANHEFGNQKACLETLFLRLPGIYYQSNNTDTAYLAGTTRNGVEFGMDNNIFELLMLLWAAVCCFGLLWPALDYCDFW